MSIVILEGPARGFLSNYTTILITVKQLVERLKYKTGEIFISPQMFSLYGNPVNWFDKKIVEHPENSKLISSLEFFNFSPWPTQEQLNLKEYIKYVPYNLRVSEYIKENLKTDDTFVGVHFRGTDHSGHIDRVDIEVYYEFVEIQLEKYNLKKIFVATDEENIIEKFQNKFSELDIVYNDTIKSSTMTPLHFSNFSAEEKIKLGDQVLLDSHSLSLCKSVIGKTSNIINYARILNPNLITNYVDTHLQFR